MVKFIHMNAIAACQVIYPESSLINLLLNNPCPLIVHLCIYVNIAKLWH